MAVSAFSLVTLDEVKDHLGIPLADASFDVTLERIIDRSSAWIDAYLSRLLISREWTEIQDGTRGNSLVLRNYPAWDISFFRSRSEDGTFDDPALDIPAAQYALEDSSVIRLIQGRILPRGTMNLKVVYQAGYRRADQTVTAAPLLPLDIVMACVLMVEFYYQTKNDRSINVSSKSRSGQSVSLIHDTPAEVKNLLEAHRRLEFAALNLPVMNL